MADVEGEAIEYKQWAHPSPRAVFLLVHGLGAHAGRWDTAGDFFAQKGISSYAIELKNFNSTDDRPYFFRDIYAKILRLHQIVTKEHPGKPVFLVGESMGAISALLVISREQGLFSGLICLSPAFASHIKPIPIKQLKIAPTPFYKPNKQFKLPFDSAMCTRDADYIKKMDEDPREYRTVSAKLILDLLLAQTRSRNLKAKIKLPVLFLLAGEDKLVDPGAARKIFNSMKVKDKKLVEFPGMYHALSIDLGKEKVFEEMSRWVEERI